MAETTTLAPVVAPADQGKINADLAAKVAAQDIMGQSLATTSTDAGPALDELAKAHDDAAKKEAEEAEAKRVADEAAANPTPEQKEAAEKEAADKLAAEKAAAEVTANEDTRAKDLFKDAPSLPPGAAPKSSEAFATVKLIAAREVARVEAELQKAREDLKAAQALSANPTTEQLAQAKELEDLRMWRAKMDVDFDPKFKEFDKNIEAARDFIYAQLRRSPVVTEDTIAQIKKFGGPESTNMVKLFESMGDPTIQRVIESKVSDILQAKYQKDLAIKQSKDNISEYVEARKTELNQAVTGHVTETKAQLDSMLPNLEWMADKEVKGTDGEKKEAQEHNAFVSGIRTQLDEALSDDSPTMRAILLTGMAQLFNVQRSEKKVKAELAALQKDHATLQGKWEKIVSASKSRLTQSGAPTTATAPAAKVSQFSTPAGDALDALAKQIQAEREAKGATR